jgi:multidrug efflux pump subunit AcrA (membrane-fusion protein)
MRRTPSQPVLLLLLGAMLGACERAPDVVEPERAMPVRVRVTEVRRGAISDVLSVTGETVALSTVRLGSPVLGRIATLGVRPGDRLAKDEVVARVISFENEAALQGFAALAKAGKLTADEQRLTQGLQKDIGARAIAVRAPFAAVVAERSKNPGELVAQGDVLVELFDPSSLCVLAQIPVESAARVRVGLPVQVSIGDTVSPGEVTALVSALVPQSLTVPVRIALATPLSPPLLHAPARCRIALAHDPDALLIPRSALVSTTAARQGTVMIAQNGRAWRRSIALAMQTPDVVAVGAGLRAGELVLTDGQYGLPDGTRIQAEASVAE